MEFYMSEYMLGYMVTTILIILFILSIILFFIWIHNKSLAKKQDVTKNSINKDNKDIYINNISNFPHVWIGFFIALAFIFLEILELLISDIDFHYILSIILISGFIYWLFCLQRIHKIFAEVSKNVYPINPGSLVAGHIIPFYNIYWIFKWPIELSNFIRAHTDVSIISGWVLGLLLLLSLLLNKIDSGFSLICIFAIVFYIAKKVNKYAAYILN
jgi:hypothetical protein